MIDKVRLKVSRHCFFQHRSSRSNYNLEDLKSGTKTKAVEVHWKMICIKKLVKLKTKLYWGMGGWKKLIQEKKQRQERRQNTDSLSNDNRKIKAWTKQQKQKLHLLDIKIRWIKVIHLLWQKLNQKTVFNIKLWLSARP